MTIATCLGGDQGLLKSFNSCMRAKGVLKSESKFYISLAHDEADIALTKEAISVSSEAAAKTL